MGQQQHVDVGVGAGHYQDLLNRPDVQKAVRAFLGENSSAYLEVLQQCQSAILLIAKAIKGFEAGSWVGEKITLFPPPKQQVVLLKSPFPPQIKGRKRVFNSPRKCQTATASASTHRETARSHYQ